MVSVSKSAKSRMLAVNERGQRIGDSHPRAVLSDRDVELVLELRAEGYSLGWIARKMECSKSQVGRIVRGDQRGQVPAAFRRALGGR